MLIKKFDDVRSNLRGGGLALCAAGLLLSGCGGGGGGDGGGNNAGANSAGGQTSQTPAAAPAATTSLTVTPQNLEFNKVVIGDTVGGAVVVSNTGTTTVDLELLNVGEGFALTNPCGALAPEEECSLLFEFTPMDQKMYASAPTVVADTEELPLSLSGQGQGLNVEVSSVDQMCVDGKFSASLLVTRSSGETATGLRTDNVSAFLDGVAVDMTGSDLESLVDRDPIAVGVLLDLSGSLDGSEAAISDATSIFLDGLGHTEDGVIDRAGLFKFGSEIDFSNSQNFTDVNDAGKAALNEALYGGFAESASNSKIWGSVSRVGGIASEETIEERYVILLTDGRENPFDPSTSPTLDDLIAGMNSRNVSVFTIGFGDVDPGPLQRLADETGGFFFSDPGANALGAGFDQIASTFLNEYRIEIMNPDSAEEFTIQFIDDAGREGEDTITLPACP